VNNFQDVDVAE